MNPHTFQPIDPAYGRIRFLSTSWKMNEYGYFEISSTPLETHSCSDEEIALSSHGQKFWAINDAQGA